MTLQQLRYAIEVARCGSMNEAAKKLFISQPTLSNAIKELENELDIVIFDRTNRGISISIEGIEFLRYARQIVEQTELLESRYHGSKVKPEHFSISTQHYTFVVNAFVKLMNEIDINKYEFKLKETKTYEIIEDVKTLQSEIGILYINDFNSKLMNKLFSDNNLKFTTLFNVNPHIIVGKNHPLGNRESVTLEDLASFPCIAFEQGDNNSLHFSEEMIDLSYANKIILVSDRGTLSNLLSGTHGYTVGTGTLNFDLNGDEIKAVPIECDEMCTLGWIAHKDIKLSKIAARYIDILNDVISTSYFDLSYYLL